MHGAVSVLKTELSGLRTGRASVNLLDPVSVNAYGQQMPINQVATINVPEPRMLSVQVWDKQLAGRRRPRHPRSQSRAEPDHGRHAAAHPDPRAQRASAARKWPRSAHKYAEQARIAVRHVRRDGMDKLKKLEKDGHHSLDDTRVQSEKLQELTDATIKEIDEMLAAKEREITQV